MTRDNLLVGRAALLIIDMQHDFGDQQIVTAIQRLVTVARLGNLINQPRGCF